MLRHIFKTVNTKKLFSLPNNSMCSYVNISFLNKLKCTQDIATTSIYRNIHIYKRNYAKIFQDHENNYVYSVIFRENHVTTDLYATSSIDEIEKLEDFNNILNQDFRNSTATEILETFLAVKNYCTRNGICVSDTRFDKLVDGLTDQCENLTDSELLHLLNCIVEYPQCESYTSHNFHDLWSCLDDICCWRITEWSVDEMFMFANVWYKLNLGKLCDYIFSMLDRLVRRAERLTKDQIVNIFFYLNICRRRAVDFEFEFALEKHINDMNVDEMAVVGLGCFKTKTKIKLVPIQEAMVKKITENSKNIHEISLTAILKGLRYSKPIKIVPQIFTMLDSLEAEIDRLSHLCCLHVALITTSLLIIHKNTLTRISQKLAKDIDKKEKVRLKDIERLLNVLSMIDFDPKTQPDVFKAALQELEKEERREEFVRYPRCIPCALNYLSLRNIYSYKLMDEILDVENITEIYGKEAKRVPRELLSLDTSIDIECSGYKGRRLPLELKYKVAKWQTEFTPSYEQYKKITASDQLILNTIDTVKEIVQDDKLLHIDHVLPHFPRADIIVCKDKNSGEFIKPVGFEKYILGDIMFPSKNENLEWFSLIVVGWNNTVRDTNRPLGQIVMKQRQLEKIGYKPVLVIGNEFIRLSKEDKIDYILRKLT